MSTVHVKLFARARDLAGASEVMLVLAARASVADLRRALGEQHPGRQGLLSRSAIAVNGDFAADSLTIPENAEIALLPPVSGGGIR